MPPDPALLLLQHSAERLGPSAPAPTHQLPSVPPPDGLSILDSASLFQISPSKTPTASGIVTPAENQLSLDSLELEAYKAVTAFAGDAQISKKTQEMYGRHLREYVAFFEQREAEKLKEDPNYVPLLALPITPAKAALFVLNEMQRSKVSVFAVLFFFFLMTNYSCSVPGMALIFLPVTRLVDPPSGNQSQLLSTIVYDISTCTKTTLRHAQA